MFPDLTPLKHAIGIRTDHIVDKHTTFRVQQHGKALSSGNFTIFAPHDADAAAAAAGEASSSTDPPTFPSVDGKYLSFDEKRSFRDASGLPLFDVYHRKQDLTWYIELPGGNGVPIGRARPRASSLKDNLDVEITNAVGGGEVSLNVQGQDIWKQRTNVYLGDTVVMTAKRMDKLSVYVPGRKVEWRVDIAQGMDMSLASVIMIILAATMYDSSLQAVVASS